MAELADNGTVREFEYRDDDFQSIRQRLYSIAGINLSDSKKQLVYSRIARRVRAVRLRSFSDYLHYLDQHTAEEEEFVNALTTNLTSFFREPHHFDTMHDYLVRESRPGRRFNLWCAAASTGEEPYSMAMVALEALGPNPPVRIVATDIDSRVLATARAGIYPLDRTSSLSRSRLEHFCLRGVGRNEGKVKVRQELKRLVEFRSLNLLSPVWPVDPPFDLIFCRNVMIYFDKTVQKQVLNRMIPLLSDDGLYFAGHSENFVNVDPRIKPAGKTTYRIVGHRA